MLCVARGLARYHHELTPSLGCSAPSWFHDADTMLYGKTLSVIGCGRVGKAVARKAQGLGMHIVYYDPYRLDKAREQALGLRFAPFEEALGAGDVVSIHMPYTPQTHHLINDAAFARMRPSAYFINTARGPIVEEAALVRALSDNRIRGAALDVFEREPAVSPELAALGNVVLTPHVGTMILETRLAMVREALFGIRAVLSGNKPTNLVAGELTLIRTRKQSPQAPMEPAGFVLSFSSMFFHAAQRQNHNRRKNSGGKQSGLQLIQSRP
jgi:glyoxylate reductase